MKIEIHVSDDRRSFSLSIDGGGPVLLDNFILLTKEGEMTRNLVFGSGEEVGRLLFGLYANSWRFEEFGLREVLESVAEDIRDSREGRERRSEETIRRLM
ncbi:MAG: hypothetical protein Kow00128_15510 [Deltaproteobacteria bacterium]